jgi:hypothetical protein
MSKFGRLRKVVVAWKEKDDIEIELYRIERKISNCYQRFSVRFLVIFSWTRVL